MSEDLPDEVVPDRFQQATLINTGGFGEVWKAKDTATGATVAIKLPLQAGRGQIDPTGVSMFEQEKRILETIRGGFRPSSVVGYVDGRTGEIPYIAFEYIDGTDLDDHLQRVEQEPGREAVCKYALPILRAVEFLHSNGIGYLDLKPENVLVRSHSRQPVLIDFNAAVTDTGTERLFSADDFKAPEQIQGTKYSYSTAQQADVYAAGKLVYYLLTGETGTNDEPPQAISDAATSAGFPDGVVSTLTRSLVADPTRRVRDIREISSALRDACQPAPASNKRGRLIDPEQSLECSVYPGDSVGCLTTDGPTSDLLITDPNEYISPRHFAFDHDGESWIIHDHSLNGTYVDYGSETHFLLSDDGYARLSADAPERVPDSPPPSAMRVRRDVTIKPVSEQYPCEFKFETW